MLRAGSAPARAPVRGADAGVRRRRLRRAGLVLDLDADQLRSDREHLSDLAAEREHLAGDRRRDLDRRLVGHHVGEPLVLDDRVAGRDVPDDELDLGDAFAEVGDADDVDAHVGRSTAPSRA